MERISYEKYFIFVFIYLFIYFSPVNASPVSFDFTHDGFDLGATVTGSFSGEDLNENGKLEAEFGEISVFEMYFSGNASVTTFSFQLSELSLFNFTYDLDGENLSETDFNGIFIESGLLDYHGFFTSNSDKSSSVSDSQTDEGGVSPSSQFIQVSARPVSAADEIKKKANQDNRFGISIEGNDGENLEWHSDWELRWQDFVFSGLPSHLFVRVFHITNKQDSSEKYTVFYDPDTEKWTEWTKI